MRATFGQVRRLKTDEYYVEERSNESPSGWKIIATFATAKERAEWLKELLKASQQDVDGNFRLPTGYAGEEVDDWDEEV